MNYAESLDDGKHPARLSKEEKIRLQRRTANIRRLLLTASKKLMRKRM